MSEMPKCALTVYWNTAMCLKQTAPSPPNGHETHWNMVHIPEVETIMGILTLYFL